MGSVLGSYLVTEALALLQAHVTPDVAERVAAGGAVAACSTWHPSRSRSGRRMQCSYRPATR